MMRKNFIYLFACLFVLASCGDSDKYLPDVHTSSLKAHYLRPSQTSFSAVTSRATSFDFDITSIGTPWMFKNDVDWFSVSPNSGLESAKANLAITENLSGDSQKIGVFFLQSAESEWEYQVPLSVSQAAATPYATVSSKTVTFNGSASSETVWITSNCTWDINFSASWISVEKGNNLENIKIQASENTTNTSRSATVYLIFNGKNLASVSVTQKAANVTLDTQTLNFENIAADCTVKVTSEASWTAKTSQTWVQVSPESGKTGTSELKISVTPNTSVTSRTGYVYLYVGTSQVVQIQIVQKGIYVEFSAESLTMEAGVDEKTVSIKSNTTWTISSCPEWCTVTPTSGEGTTNVTIKTTDNPNISKREGTIKAIQAGLSLEATMKVVQNGKTIDYGSGTIECSDKAQTLSVSISSNGYWKASTTDSWITVNPTSASGSGVLSVSVTENTADDARTGKVTLTIGDKSFEISIIQSGKYFTVNFENNDIGSTGGNVSISISSNDEWSATTTGSPSWITLSKTSGNGSADFTASVVDNPSVNSRTANIILTTVHGLSVKIIVTQAARYMTVDHQDILFFAKGGESDNITISTDGKYTISKSVSWFSISEKGNGVFTVTAEENNGKDAREASITITMTDLKEGTYAITLPVIQTCYGGTFVVSGYGEDKNWDIGASYNVSLTVTGYSTDKNWDVSAYGVKFNVTITGFNNDKNWDSNTNSSGNIGTGDYPSDSNYDSKTSSQGNISTSGYGSDSNWNN